MSAIHIDPARLAVLDPAYLGNIQGAFGTILVQTPACRQVCWRSAIRDRRRSKSRIVIVR